MEDYELELLKLSKAERGTLPLNHLTTFTKEIPGTEAYDLVRLRSSKMKFQSATAFRTNKPISKMGVEPDESP